MVHSQNKSRIQNGNIKNENNVDLMRYLVKLILFLNTQ